MRRRSATAVASALGVVASMLLVGAASSVAHAASSPQSTVGLLAYNNTNLHATDPAHYSVVIINADQYAEIPAIRAASPGVKILVYKNVAMAETYDVSNGVDNPFLPTGVGYAWAKAQHPGWFLKDTNGNMVEWADYPQRWWLDMGDASYQNTWAANVIAEVKNYGLDGVMMDDVDMHTGGHLASGTTLAKYPTDAAYARANESFLANVGPQLHAAGVLGVANIAFRWNPNWEAPYKQWLTEVDGVLMEFWMKPGQDSTFARFGDNDWTYQMQQAADVLAAGKMFLPLTYGAMSDATTQAYARASFLLAWDGGRSSDVWVPSTNGQDPWSPEVSAAVGAPTGSSHQLASGVWQRSFTGGVVLVNSSQSATRTVSLGGSFVTAAGRTVTSLSMAPMTGAVLSNTSVPTPDPTATTPTPDPTATTPAAPAPTVLTPRHHARHRAQGLSIHRWSQLRHWRAWIRHHPRRHAHHARAHRHGPAIGWHAPHLTVGF
ncbi:MAG: hypothetical protein QOF18_217 [Frankiaceae bacterium]|nr:hypothetical protein [Frankiaceae bacterium]